MKPLITGVAALALAALAAPVFAQSTTTQPNSSTPQQNEPGDGGRSKVGVPGQPGNKSGPSDQRGETGAATGEEGDMSPNDNAAGSDNSKVPGLPGNKSGPAQKSPTK